jgi:hypothetical protein
VVIIRLLVAVSIGHCSCTSCIRVHKTELDPTKKNGNAVATFFVSTLNKIHTDTISAALGSVIGYLGAEVARPEMFERVFWPERFHNLDRCYRAGQDCLAGPDGRPVA